MLICSWIYLTQSTSSTSRSGMLMLISLPLVNMCSFFWLAHLGIDSEYGFMLQLFYIHQHGKVCENSGSLSCFWCAYFFSSLLGFSLFLCKYVELMWFWPFVADKTVMENSETENETKDRLVSVSSRLFECNFLCCFFLVTDDLGIFFLFL